MTEGAVLIDSVEPARHAAATALDARLEAPVPGGREPGFAVSFRGHAVGGPAGVGSIEVRADGETVSSIPVDPATGFDALVGTVGLPRDFDLSLEALLADGARVQLWSVHGRQAPLIGPPSPGIRPVQLRTMGRTGSVWLLHLLDQHPEVVVYRPFTYEPRVVPYWAEVLRALSDPRGYLWALRPQSTESRWWLGPQQAEQSPPPEDEALREALGRRAVEELAALARARIEDFYATLAAQRGKDRAVCFVEKDVRPHPSARPVWRIVEELYPDILNIALVRDPRDMVCSMRAYSERRGLALFGRGNAAGEDEWVHELGEAAASQMHEHQARGRRSLLLRYEDLLERPERALGDVFRHMGVESAPEVAAECLARASEPLPGMELHRTSGEDPRASVGRWRRDLPEPLRAQTEEAFRELMKANGYAIRRRRLFGRSWLH